MHQRDSAVEGRKLWVHRLAAEGRSLREAILRWFEDVPERRLPERGVLGGTMGASVIAFPAGFTGGAGDDFLVQLEDGHILVVYRYEVTPARFWDSGNRVQGGALPWERLLRRRGFEVWQMSQSGFVPFTPGP